MEKKICVFEIMFKATIVSLMEATWSNNITETVCGWKSHLSTWSQSFSHQVSPNWSKSHGSTFRCDKVGRSRLCFFLPEKIRKNQQKKRISGTWLDERRFQASRGHDDAGRQTEGLGHRLERRFPCSCSSASVRYRLWTPYNVVHLFGKLDWNVIE